MKLCSLGQALSPITSVVTKRAVLGIVDLITATPPITPTAVACCTQIPGQILPDATQLSEGDSLETWQTLLAPFRARYRASIRTEASFFSGNCILSSAWPLSLHALDKKHMRHRPYNGDTMPEVSARAFMASMNPSTQPTPAKDPPMRYTHRLPFVHE